MGLQLAPGLKSLKSKEPRVVLSSEQLTLLDSDLILAVDGSKSDRPKVEADSRYQGLPAVKSGAILWFDLPVIYGLDTPTVLSIPYCLDYIKPTPQKAAKL
jgi:ABC-type Fe3+-hydroxamate transport system substrate-binding protein